MAYVPHNAYGPWLRYQDWDVNTNAWTGSVLVVSLGPQPPQLSLWHGGQSFAPQPVCLDSFQNFTFWRWQLDLRLQPQESPVEYRITAEWAVGQPYEKRSCFTLPGSNQCWHWGFHSCNGFSHGVENSWEQAATALWQDVLSVHRQSALHCMVGGGDQLYQDGFFKEPAFMRWLSIKERGKREKAEMTPEMAAEVGHFMFHHYCNWFSKEHMAEAFACIPQVMTWDDHDLMDGYGSYPEALQTCPVFQHVFQVGRRFYLLFQQHTTLGLAKQQANLFGSGETLSLVRLLGHNVALVAPDVRSERTRKQVVSPASWQLIFDRIAALPTTVRHIVMLTTIPVVYPKIPLTEKAMGLMSAVGREGAVDMLLTKTGLWGAVRGKVVSGFNEPELLDDLLDHWTSDYHAKEREMLIKRLQDIGRTRNARVCFISGDVHVGGLGRLYSHPKVDLRMDFRFMPQIISSAIMNAPPPAGVVSTLHTCSNAHMSGVDKNTKEKMVRLFKQDYPKTEKLVARRNWATLRELPPGAPPPAVQIGPKDPPLQPGDLLVTLRVEHDHKQPQLPVKQYHIPVPTLYMLQGSGYGAPPPSGGYGVPLSPQIAQPGQQSLPYLPPSGAGYVITPPAQGAHASSGDYGSYAAPVQSYGSLPTADPYAASQQQSQQPYPGLPPAQNGAQGYGQPSGYGSASYHDPQAQGAYAVTPASNAYGQQQAGYGAPTGYSAPSGGYGQSQVGYDPSQSGNLAHQFSGLNVGGAPAQSQAGYYPPPPVSQSPGGWQQHY